MRGEWAAIYLQQMINTQLRGKTFAQDQTKRTKKVDAIENLSFRYLEWFCNRQQRKLSLQEKLEIHACCWLFRVQRDSNWNQPVRIISKISDAVKLDCSSSKIKTTTKLY